MMKNSVSDSEMDFHSMKRKDLQALCKKHQIPANLTNREMADQLSLRFQVGCGQLEDKHSKPGRSCLKNLDEDVLSSNDDKLVNKEAKKVRFSPIDETLEFEMTDPRAVRLAGRRRRKSVHIGNNGNQSTDSESTVKMNCGGGRKSLQNVVEKQVLVSESGGERPVSGGGEEIPIRTTRSRGKRAADAVVSEKSKSDVEELAAAKGRTRGRKAMDEHSESRNEGVPDCGHEVAAVLRRSTRRAANVTDYDSSKIGKLPARNSRSTRQVAENVDSEHGESGAVAENEANESNKAISCQPEAGRKAARVACKRESMPPNRSKIKRDGEVVEKKSSKRQREQNEQVTGGEMKSVDVHLEQDTDQAPSRRSRRITIIDKSVDVISKTQTEVVDKEEVGADRQVRRSTRTAARRGKTVPRGTLETTQKAVGEAKPRKRRRDQVPADNATSKEISPAVEQQPHRRSIYIGSKSDVISDEKTVKKNEDGSISSHVEMEASTLADEQFPEHSNEPAIRSEVFKQSWELKKGAEKKSSVRKQEGSTRVLDKSISSEADVVEIPRAESEQLRLFSEPGSVKVTNSVEDRSQNLIHNEILEIAENSESTQSQGVDGDAYEMEKTTTVAAGHRFSNRMKSNAEGKVSGPCDQLEVPSLNVESALPPNRTLVDHAAEHRRRSVSEELNIPKMSDALYSQLASEVTPSSGALAASSQKEETCFNMSVRNQTEAVANEDEVCKKMSLTNILTVAAADCPVAEIVNSIETSECGGHSSKEHSSSDRAKIIDVIVEGVTVIHNDQGTVTFEEAQTPTKCQQAEDCSEMVPKDAGSSKCDPLDSDGRERVLSDNANEIGSAVQEPKLVEINDSFYNDPTGVMQQGDTDSQKSLTPGCCAANDVGENIFSSRRPISADGKRSAGYESPLLLDEENETPVPEDVKTSKVEIELETTAYLVKTPVPKDVDPEENIVFVVSAGGNMQVIENETNTGVMQPGDTGSQKSTSPDGFAANGLGDNIFSPRRSISADGKRSAGYNSPGLLDQETSVKASKVEFELETASYIERTPVPAYVDPEKDSRYEPPELLVEQTSVKTSEMAVEPETASYIEKTPVPEGVDPEENIGLVSTAGGSMLVIEKETSTGNFVHVSVSREKGETAKDESGGPAWPRSGNKPDHAAERSYCLSVKEQSATKFESSDKLFAPSSEQLVLKDPVVDRALNDEANAVSKKASEEPEDNTFLLSDIKDQRRIMCHNKESSGSKSSPKFDIPEEIFSLFRRTPVHGSSKLHNDESLESSARRLIDSEIESMKETVSAFEGSPVCAESLAERKFVTVLKEKIGEPPSSHNGSDQDAIAEASENSNVKLYDAAHIEEPDNDRASNLEESGINDEEVQLVNIEQDKANEIDASEPEGNTHCALDVEGSGPVLFSDKDCEASEPPSFDSGFEQDAIAEASENSNVKLNDVAQVEEPDTDHESNLEQSVIKDKEAEIDVEVNEIDSVTRFADSNTITSASNEQSPDENQHEGQDLISNSPSRKSKFAGNEENTVYLSHLSGSSSKNPECSGVELSMAAIDDEHREAASLELTLIAATEIASRRSAYLDDKQESGFKDSVDKELKSSTTRAGIVDVTRRLLVGSSGCSKLDVNCCEDLHEVGAGDSGEQELTKESSLVETDKESHYFLGTSNLDLSFMGTNGKDVYTKRVESSGSSVNSAIGPKASMLACDSVAEESLWNVKPVRDGSTLFPQNSADKCNPRPSESQTLKHSFEIGSNCPMILCNLPPQEVAPFSPLVMSKSAAKSVAPKEEKKASCLQIATFSRNVSVVPEAAEKSPESATGTKLCEEELQENEQLDNMISGVAEQMNNEAAKYDTEMDLSGAEVSSPFVVGHFSDEFWQGKGAEESGLVETGAEKSLEEIRYMDLAGHSAGKVTSSITLKAETDGGVKHNSVEELKLPELLYDPVDREDVGISFPFQSDCGDHTIINGDYEALEAGGDDGEESRRPLKRDKEQLGGPVDGEGQQTATVPYEFPVSDEPSPGDRNEDTANKHEGAEDGTCIFSSWEKFLFLEDHVWPHDICASENSAAEHSSHKAPQPGYNDIVSSDMRYCFDINVAEEECNSAKQIESTIRCEDDDTQEHHIAEENAQLDCIYLPVPRRTFFDGDNAIYQKSDSDEMKEDASSAPVPFDEGESFMAKEDAEGSKNQSAAFGKSTPEDSNLMGLTFDSQEMDKSRNDIDHVSNEKVDYLIGFEESYSSLAASDTVLGNAGNKKREAIISTVAEDACPSMLDQPAELMAVDEQDMEADDDTVSELRMEPLHENPMPPVEGSCTGQNKNRFILIHGTPRKMLKKHDMKENKRSMKLEQMLNVTAVKPLVKRKALQELWKN